MENKKTKVKNYYQTNKKIYQKGCESIMEAFLKIKENKNGSSANNRNKNMSDDDSKNNKRIYEKLLL